MEEIAGHECACHDIVPQKCKAHSADNDKWYKTSWWHAWWAEKTVADKPWVGLKFMPAFTVDLRTTLTSSIHLFYTFQWCTFDKMHHMIWVNDRLKIRRYKQKSDFIYASTVKSCLAWFNGVAYTWIQFLQDVRTIAVQPAVMSAAASLDISLVVVVAVTDNVIIDIYKVCMSNEIVKCIHVLTLSTKQIILLVHYIETTNCFDLCCHVLHCKFVSHFTLVKQWRLVFSHSLHICLHISISFLCPSLTFHAFSVNQSQARVICL